MSLCESSQAADHEIKWGLCHEAQIYQAFSKGGVVDTYDRSEDLCCIFFYVQSSDGLWCGHEIWYIVLGVIINGLLKEGKINIHPIDPRKLCTENESGKEKKKIIASRKKKRRRKISAPAPTRFYTHCPLKKSLLIPEKTRPETKEI